MKSTLNFEIQPEGVPSYLLRVREVREDLQSEGTDDRDHRKQSAAEKDHPWVLAQEEDVPDHCIYLIFKHLINPDPHCWLTATNFINDIFPMGMQLMEINVTFSKKLNLLHNPGSKIRTSI